jgi:hypothetical protein
MAWFVAPIPNSSGMGVPHGTSVLQIPLKQYLFILHGRATGQCRPLPNAGGGRCAATRLAIWLVPAADYRRDA